jgi:hypothetical protein
MRFYTQQPPFYCGIARQARPMSVCLLAQDGEIVVHRNLQASPDTVLKTIAPYRDNIVIAVECVFTGSWLAALCAPRGPPRRARPRPLHDRHPRRPGYKREERRPEDCRVTPRWPAPAGLRLSGRHAGASRPAPAADAFDAQARGVARAPPKYQQAVSPACDWEEDRLHSEPRRCQRAISRARWAEEHRRRPGAAWPRRPVAPRRGPVHPQHGPAA